MEYNDLKKEELIKFIRTKILEFSTTQAEMQQSIDYYNYSQDIEKKQRLAIGRDGKVVIVPNLPNSRILDNQFARIVDQKVNYLFSLPPTVEHPEEDYQEQIQELYNKKFLRTLNKIALESYLCGISWLYVYVEDGDLKYKKIDAREIIPIWSDNNHESLDAVIRSYKKKVIEDGKVKEKNRIAFYTDTELTIFESQGNEFKVIEKRPYMIDAAGKGISFEKIPFIYFKGNSQEIPIIKRCKSIQDAINTIMSNFMDNMLEDKRNTIIVLKNYDGENLGEFRENLSTYGAVKVRTADGSQGGVEALEIEVNSENYVAILEILKEKLIENMRGIDGSNHKNSQLPNELNIKTMYSNIEIDANAIELEFTASLEHLEWFYRAVHQITDDSNSTVTFKRNMLVNDESVVDMIRDSVGILSQETLIANHPFTSDVSEELEKLESESKKELESLSDYTGIGADYGLGR